MAKQNLDVTTSDTEKKRISYTQLSMYNTCNRKWYLSYVEKLSTYESNIHLLFGTAMHETLQTYIKTMFDVNVTQADMLDLNKMLLDNMMTQFKEIVEKSGIEPCTLDDLKEFFNDGVAILDFFKKHRADYFSNNGCELVGIEVPLKIDLGNNLEWISFLDLVIKNKVSKKIKIIDLKTSTYGWRDYKKKDDNTNAQLIIYKNFYAKQYDVPLDSIDVEFVILKRKLYENTDYPQKRIQTHVPISGTKTINKHMDTIFEFVKNSFNSDGSYNKNREYKKSPGKQCEWCEFFGTHCK